MIKRLLQALSFFMKTGIRQSTVHRVFRSLSNLYLTPNNPGREGKLVVITSLPWLTFQFGNAITFYVDRKELQVKTKTTDQNGEPYYTEAFPLEKCPTILDLVKRYAKHGIPFPRNNEGVRYVPMPGEEEFKQNG